MEIKELRDELVPRLESIEGKLDMTNGRVRKLEIARAVMATVGMIAAFVLANVGAWLALA